MLLSLLLSLALADLTAEQRAHEMVALAGGRFVCRTDLPFWSEYEAAFLVGDTEMLERSLRIIATNLTMIFECNVGVIGGYHMLARSSLQKHLHRKAYRQLQMAMIFIFTLRNGVSIPPLEEQRWRTSKPEIVYLIRELKRRIDREEYLRRQSSVLIPDDFRDNRLRIAVASICAYPPTHRLILKDVSPGNKQWYASHHGYTAAVAMEHPRPGADIQHAKLTYMRDLLLSNQFDWVMWMDCDSLVVNPKKTIDSIIYQYTQIPDSRPLNTDDTIDGVYTDSLAPGFLIRIHASGSSALLRASGEHIGEVKGRLVNGNIVQLSFQQGVFHALAIGDKLQWENGAVWERIKTGVPDDPVVLFSHKSSYWTNFWDGFRSSKKPRELRKRCSRADCFGVPRDSGVDIIITEEGWGMSSANWIIRNSPWSVEFLSKAFTVCNSSVPFFGDQDAIISELTNTFSLSESIREEYLSSHARVIPQRLINAYDSLNAHYMQCHGYLPDDLLVTFPACKDPESCNPAFMAALRPQDCPQCSNHVRVFGPEREMAKRYKEQYGGVNDS